MQIVILFRKQLGTLGEGQELCVLRHTESKIRMTNDEIRKKSECRNPKPESETNLVQKWHRTGNYSGFVIRISLGFRNSSFVIRSGPSSAEHPSKWPVRPPAAVSQEHLRGVCGAMRDFVIRDVRRIPRDQLRVGGVASELLCEGAAENECQ